MGRRALRKINPDLDLSVHLRDTRQSPESWTSAAWFGNAAPLELEVGSGKGLFLSRIAVACPDANFVGVEVSRKYARFAAAKLARRRCSNAVLVHGDALAAIRERVPNDSLRAIHIYFPDPWWKKRHQKRRVINEQSVVDFQRALQPGGSLHFWTDVEQYFRTSLELIAEQPRLEGPWEVPASPAAHDLDYRTHFERRARLAGLTVFRSEFRKPQD
jgi:tRNA (guanine-N7-)-methyltransferase